MEPIFQPEDDGIRNLIEIVFSGLFGILAFFTLLTIISQLIGLSFHIYAIIGCIGSISIILGISYFLYKIKLGNFNRGALLLLILTGVICSTIASVNQRRASDDFFYAFSFSSCCRSAPRSRGCFTCVVFSTSTAVAVASLVFLTVLGGIAARAGGASMTVGAIRVTFWGEDNEHIAKAKEGDVIRILHGYVKEGYRGGLEYQVGRKVRKEYLLYVCR